MATQLVCDGCRVPLFRFPNETASSDLDNKELLIEGKRANGLGGLDPIPNGEFHWCARCARIAFQALRVAKANNWRE